MPIRITDGAIATRVLVNLQRNLLNMSDVQQRVSTGLRFSRPSDNPTDLVAALGFRNDLGAIQRYTRNIDRGLAQLNVTDSSLGSAGDIIQRARELAVNANDGALGVSDRAALADEVRELLNRIVESGNSALNGLYIFAGDRTQTKPFEIVSGGSTGSYVRYLGDLGERRYEISQGVAVPVNIHGLEAFWSQPNKITSTVAVADPLDRLVNQLPTAPPASNGDWTGDFTINGATITVTATDTLSSIRDKINAANVDVIAQIDANGQMILTSMRSENIDMADGTSNLLTGLGMFKRIDGGVLDGTGSLTAATDPATLGLTLEGLRISNNGVDYDINLEGAATFGDILTRINSSGAGVTAYINEAGTGLVFSANSSTDSFEVKNMRRIFGTSFGSPVDATTTLASLGVPALTALNITVGADTRQVDLSSASTIGDVLAAINSGHPFVHATINAAGDGIDIVAEEIEGLGLQDLTITEAGAGTSAADLGILDARTRNTASDLQVAGTGSAKEVETLNIFKTLLKLENALRTSTRSAGVDETLGELDIEFTDFMALRTRNGARVNRFDETKQRYSREEVFLTELLSANEDVDFAEVVTELKLQETTLNAALAAGARIVSQSLLDFLQ